MESHHNIGELYMEYLRKDCLEKGGQLCSYCQENDWVGPPMNRIPQPIPDKNRPGHFLPVANCIGPRQPDDFQPRANLKKLFKNGMIAVTDGPKISDFAKTYCVKEKYVMFYLQHLQGLKTLQSIREKSRHRQRQDKLEKTYADYDWENLVRSRAINKLLVKE